jgi:hypothetical protein
MILCYWLTGCNGADCGGSLHDVQRSAKRDEADIRRLVGSLLKYLSAVKLPRSISGPSTGAESSKIILGKQLTFTQEVREGSFKLHLLSR